MKRILKALRSRDRDLGDKIGLTLIGIGLIVFIALATLKYGEIR